MRSWWLFLLGCVAFAAKAQSQTEAEQIPQVWMRGDSVAWVRSGVDTAALIWCDSVQPLGAYMLGYKRGRCGILAAPDSLFLPFEYERLVASGESHLVLQKDGRQGVMRWDREIVVPFSYRALCLYLPEFYFLPSRLLAQGDNGLWAVIDLANRAYSDFVYSPAVIKPGLPFKLPVVKYLTRGGRWGYFSPVSDREEVPFEYDSLFLGGMFDIYAVKNGKMAVWRLHPVSEEARLKIPLRYESLRPVFARVWESYDVQNTVLKAYIFTQKGRAGLANTRGHIRVSAQYDSIASDGEVFYAHKGKNHDIYALDSRGYLHLKARDCEAIESDILRDYGVFKKRGKYGVWRSPYARPIRARFDTITEDYDFLLAKTRKHSRIICNYNGRMLRHRIDTVYLDNFGKKSMFYVARKTNGKWGVLNDSWRLTVRFRFEANVDEYFFRRGRWWSLMDGHDLDDLDPVPEPKGFEPKPPEEDE